MLICFQSSFFQIQWEFINELYDQVSYKYVICFCAESINAVIMVQQNLFLENNMEPILDLYVCRVKSN